MLTGVLLHVVAAPFGVYGSANHSSPCRWLVCFDVVDHTAVLGLDDFGDPKPLRRFTFFRGHPAGIVNLASTGWIESRAVEENPVAAIDLRRRNHLGDFTFEIAKKGIVIVETFGHVLIRCFD